MHAVATLGPWGLLIPALVFVAYIAYCLGRALFDGGALRNQLVAGIVLALALITGGMQLLLYLNGVRRTLLFALLGLATLGAHFLRKRYGATRTPSSAERLFEASIVPLLAVCVIGLGLASVAAYFLPVWQWDSLGYHLPFVNFVLQGGGLAELPPDVPYLSTYPRNVELLFTAFRATLPDDRLVDLAQLPLGVAGAAATAGIARELGARRADALCAGALWLLVPAVFLQLPTNYIDVGTAAFFLLASFFLLVPVTRATLLCAGLAIGLFLGTKPNAPPAALLLAVILIVRGVRAKLIAATVVAVLASGALGLEAYLMNLVRHGNPVWPAVVDVGPLHLPGTVSVQELLSSGAGTQKVYGSLVQRIWQSWSSLSSTPVFDMRVGGLGIVFWLALPAALYLIVRKRCILLGALLLISVLTPDPAVVRYVLPLPALVFAAALAALPLAPQLARAAVHVVLSILGVFNLRYAASGLIGEGPPLSSYPAMSWEEREQAVGANGRPEEFVKARRRLAAGEVAVYDRALWLPYLMWRSDLTNRVLRVPDGLSVQATQALLRSPRVRLIAAGTREPASTAVADDERYSFLFRCREECVVYWQN